VIRDVAQLEHGATLRGDVGVVGAGFAGLELARYLARNGLRVVLLESGRLSFDLETQRLAHVQSVGKPIRQPGSDNGQALYLPAELRGETRIRQFGGTSNTWTGKWRIFDDLDFEARPWIPHSGWPITAEELRPFYAATADDLGLEGFAAFEDSAGVARLRAAASSGGLDVSCHVWQREPLRLAREFLSELTQSELIDAVLGANATEIVLDETHERVKSIVFRSLEGSQCELEAEHFVLAVGGTESARLLLASNRQLPTGIGNENDLVGRFYANHPKHRQGVLRPRGELMDPLATGTADHLRPSPHTLFRLSDQEQRERAVLNHAIRLLPRYRFDVDYPTAAARTLRAGLRERSASKTLRGALALSRSPRKLGKVLAKTRHRGHGGPLDHYGLTMYFEQAPNPESRLYLSSERDRLGVPKLVVDWQLNSVDRESFGRITDGLREGFEQAGLGLLEFGALTLEDTFDAAHHIGATRMATDATDGVVDPDCRVFSTENLYVASSSVFPTGSSMAPTLTIIALARRLGTHLLELHASQQRTKQPVES
jgi:choline dehydrogenase-like flavoprotein